MKFLLFLILVLASFCCHTNAQNTALPDSILTIEHTYYYCVTDPAKAQQIMDQLKLLKKDKDWELDWCQADLYYNTGKYRLAVYYYEKTNRYKEVAYNPGLYMNLLSTLMECYRMNNNMQRALETAVAVIDIAKQVGNEAETGRAYMFMGVISFGQNSQKLAKEYFSLAEAHLTRSGNMEYQYHFNLTLANLMSEAGDYPKAYHYITRAEKNLEQLQANAAGLPMAEGQLSYEAGRLSALAANVLAKCGKPKEAAACYHTFMNSPCAADSRSEIYIVPYLLSIKEYRTALSVAAGRVEILRAETDTIGEDMVAALTHLMHAHELAGDKEKTLALSKQLTNLTEKIRLKDRESAALELATIYNVQEKEKLIDRQESELQKRNLWLGCSLFIILLATIIILLVGYNMRRTRNTNRAMVRQIKEMQQYRNQLEKIKKETTTGKQTVGRNGPGRLAGGKLLPDELFALADQKMRSEKLYLDSALSRDMLIELLGVRRNDFIQALNKHAGTNFTDYLNNLRLEEALRLLDDTEKISIEIIAEKSGFGSVRSFYRQFKQRYNMSPAEYRKLAGDGLKGNSMLSN